MTIEKNKWISVIKKIFKIRRIVFIRNYEEMDRYLWFDAKEGDIVYVNNGVGFSWKAILKIPSRITFKTMAGKTFWLSKPSET